MVTTTSFRTLTDRVAKSLGHPGARIVAVPHPLGGTDETTVRQWADGTVEEAIKLLTGGS